MLTVLATLAGLSCGAFVVAEDQSTWSQHRGNAGSTGVSADASVKPPLRMVWSYRCDSDTTGDAGSGLTVGAGKVFCNMAMTRSILAIDAESGAFCWEFFHRDVHYMQTSSFADGKLLVWLRRAGRSKVVALDADNGSVVWEKQLESSQGVIARRSGPAISGNRMVVADADGTSAPSIICFHLEDGSELWRRTIEVGGGKRIVAPSIAGGKVFTGTQVQFRREAKTPVHGAAIALDLDTGNPLWRNTDLVPTRPIVSDGKIAVVKFNGQPAMPKGRQKVSVLDAATGKELWSVPIWIVYGTTTITERLVILKHYGARMVAYDRGTGDQVWESRYGGGSGCSSPSISGKYAFVGTGSFNDSEGIWAWRFASPPHLQKDKHGVCWSFHAIDLTSGQSVWHCTTGNNACGDPAIAYGKLYLNSRDGRIYCYEPVGSEAQKPPSPDTTPSASAEDVRRLLAQSYDKPRLGTDWPMEGGSLDRSAAGDPHVTPPLVEAWSLDTGGRMTSPPVVQSGKAFVTSLAGKVVCADLTSGKREWEFAAGGEIKVSPAVADGVVYIASDDGRMYALNANSGRKQWEYACGGPVQCSPAVAGGVLFFGANDSHFYALDRRTGRKLWSFKTGHPLVVTTPVVHGDTVYAAQWVDWVYALDAATGRVKWRDCVPVSIESLHCYRDKLYIRSAYQIAEYNLSTGKRLRLAHGVYGYNGLAFLNDLVVCSGIDSAVAIDLSESGQPHRFQDQPAIKDVPLLKRRSFYGWPRLASMGTPLVVGEHLCFASTKGELILVKPGVRSENDRYFNQKVVWSARLGGTCHSSPIAASGHLLVGCDDGRLYAFKQDVEQP